MESKTAPIDGFEGLYEVHCDGFVRNVRTGEKLTPTMQALRYPMITIYRDGKQTCKYIHRLVAEAFIPNPMGHKFVEHKDGRTVNNQVENLRWVARPSSIDSRRKVKVKDAPKVTVEKVTAPPVRSRRKSTFDWGNVA